MITLKYIKDEIQKIAEAIEAVLNIDVTIVDENLVRALNYGLPVLAFKNNGNNKMIKNNGYLVNDKISFIDRIETMYYDNKDYKINKNEVNKYLISNIVKDIEKKPLYKYYLSTLEHEYPVSVKSAGQILY